jgi:hypothetical protein
MARPLVDDELWELVEPLRRRLPGPGISLGALRARWRRSRASRRDARDGEADAPRTRGALVLPGAPLPRLDHPGLAHDLGRRGARHVPTAARHHLAQRRGMGGRARSVPPRTRGRRRGQAHPDTDTALGGARDGPPGASRRDERRGSRLPCDGGRRSGPRASSWVAAGVVANRPAVTPPRVAQARSFVLGASRPGCWCSSSPPTTRSARWSPHQEVSR